MASPAPIVRRRVQIDFASAKAERWCGDGHEDEDVMNAISFSFPSGEDYFVNSYQVAILLTHVVFPTSLDSDSMG